MVNFFTFERPKLAQLLAGRPSAVAITTTFYVDPAPIIEVVRFVRERAPGTRVIVGGPHVFNIASDFDEETQDFLFQQIGADIYIIDSQGEDTLARVASRLRAGGRGDLQGVPNLYYTADHEAFHRTLRVPENNDLDENAIDWSQFDPRELTPTTYLRTARSCPFACAFCNYPTLAGEHVVGDVDAVERQLRQLHEAGTTDLVFIDDTFNVPLPRFRNLLRMMIRNAFRFRWISFFRCSNADEEAFDLMRESGCVGVLLGIESGDNRVLKYMDKSATREKYEWGIRQLKERDIATFVSLICGFPGETAESVRNSIEFVEGTAPTFFNAQLYYHDTRAPIQARAEEFQIRGAGYNWRHRTMDWREAAHWAGTMFQDIRNSIPMPLYGLSLWGISYLISRGIPLETIKQFGRLARPMLLASLDDVPCDSCALEAQLAELFRGHQPTRLRVR
jgi:p-methyltransferase